MNVLIFAPHPDDEVLGCGATALKLAKQGHKVYCCDVCNGVPPLFTPEEVAVCRAEQLESHKLLGICETFFLQFPSVMLEEEHRYVLNGRILEVINKVKPELVFIPHFGDMQKDHRLVSEAVMVGSRPRGNYTVKKILAYETLSETEWNIPHAANAFMPNCYVDVSEEIDAKLAAISCFKSQLAEFPFPRSAEAVEALAKLRGSTVGVKAAEAFSVVRDIW